MDIAHIISGKVKGVYLFDDLPDKGPQEGFYRNVTDEKPKPGPGWTYTDQDTFLPPVSEPAVTISDPASDLAATIDWDKMTDETGKALKAIALKLELIKGK